MINLVWDVYKRHLKTKPARVHAESYCTADKMHPSVPTSAVFYFGWILKPMRAVGTADLSRGSPHRPGASRQLCTEQALEDELMTDENGLPPTEGQNMPNEDDGGTSLVYTEFSR